MTDNDYPLLNRRVLVTRPVAQSGAFIAALERLGAHVIPFPTIEIAPPPSWERLDAAIRRLDSYDWVIFTSVNGVRFFRERLQATGQPPDSLTLRRVAAIGPATARAIEALGVAVDIIPDEYVAEAVAEALGDVAGQRILLPRAAEAREVLTVTLRERGAVVDEIAAYHTLPGRPAPESLTELDAGIDIATFTSSSTVRNFFALLGEAKARDVLRGALVACIGPITARTAADLGAAVGVVAEVYTTEGLIDAIVQALLASE
ncbi:MAG: uroporphyrinogen-III synthase [Anaerolineae bacterium]